MYRDKKKRSELKEITYFLQEQSKEGDNCKQKTLTKVYISDIRKLIAM